MYVFTSSSTLDDFSFVYDGEGAERVGPPHSFEQVFALAPGALFIVEGRGQIGLAPLLQDNALAPQILHVTFCEIPIIL